ncbi:MAG: hypothetical protein QN720_13260 [Nitrososphaeraceae archaeon]|nr:hypothetical protein [Nitrososphaeraceae archaeon]MDW0333920.1 hypothetical protein [Nitrososphaeraceae archaeon]
MTIQSTDRGDLGRAYGGPKPFFSHEIQPISKDIEPTEQPPALPETQNLQSMHGSNI